MVQIEKRKKKGRPSKADLEARRAVAVSKLTAEEEQEQSDVRRSLRRRSFRYNIIDYDEDYLDDDEVFEEEDDEDDDDDDDDDEERRDKKVKLVVKLNNNNNNNNNNNSNSNSKRGRRRESTATRPGRRRRVAASGGDSDEELVVVKKRKVNGTVADEELMEEDDDEVVAVAAAAELEEEVEEDEEEEEEEGDVDDDVDEDGEGKGGRKDDDDNVPGTPKKENDDADDDDNGPTRLPDKKQLEVILDKLQKKDTYGVYSEPVDPEELPDYHEVIEHPMDFSTLRKKLADGAYSTLEEFESDVFLISSNAMQYNASDTVYHKQARTIKELAEKKFQRIRIRIKRSEMEPKPEPKSEPKSELKEKPCSLVKKQMKKPLWRGMQESVGSDFSSGATLAAADVHNSCGVDFAANHERPNTHDGPIGVSSLTDHNIEKADDPPSGKGVMAKIGKRSFVVDENRRATYNISNQPEDRPESIFTTFESDKKQLIPVGLSGEYAYARSLARYAANLGPIAWKIASKRIEQVLPPGFKYGRGWIGEYEPLPTAVLVVAQRKDPYVTRSHSVIDSGNHDKIPEGQAPVSSNLLNQPTCDTKFLGTFSSGGLNQSMSIVSAPQQHITVHQTSGVPSNVMPNRIESNCLPSNGQQTGATFQQQISFPRNAPCHESTGLRKVEPNSPTISDHKKDRVSQRQHPQGVEVGRRSTERNSPSMPSQKLDNGCQKQPHHMDNPASRPITSVPMGKNFLQSLPFRQPESSGYASEALANGKRANNFVDSNRVSSSPGTVSTQRPVGSFPQRENETLSDPVLVMKMMAEKAQRQQNGSAHPHGPSLARPSVLSPRGDAGGAAGAAASAWMSVGALGFRPPPQNPSLIRSQMSADSLYNGSRVFYPQAMQSRGESPVSGAMRSQPETKGLPFPAFAPQPIRVNGEAQFQNRPMGFPQLATSDLSRFQVQTPWRGLSPQTQQKQKQDTLPPDLNVAFQSSVDSPQPDLALQL